MNEENSAYVKIVNEYEKLDQLIINHERSGKPFMRFAFTIQFWFMDGWEIEKRALLVEIAKYFYDLFPNDITHFQKNGANRLSKITDKKFPIYFEQVNRRISSNEYFMISIGDFRTEPTTCEFMSLAVTENRKERRPLSYAEFRFPLSWVKLNLDRLMIVLSKISDKLKPVHATGGISPVFSEGRDVPKYYFPYLKRFPGLDFINSSWGLAVGTQRKIRGVNWLTILDDEYINDLGGLEKLKEKLGEDIIVHEYDGGGIIQAGPEPFVGDINNNLWPEHYRTVSKVLKHLRFEDYKVNRPYLKVPHDSPLDSYDESLKWIRRFDVEETE